MERTPLSDGLITAATSLSGENILRRKNQATDRRFIRLTSGMLCRGPAMLALLKPIASEQQGAAAAAAHINHRHSH